MWRWRGLPLRSCHLRLHRRLFPKLRTSTLLHFLRRSEGVPLARALPTMCTRTSWLFCPGNSESRNDSRGSWFYLLCIISFHLGCRLLPPLRCLEHELEHGSLTRRLMPLRPLNASRAARLSASTVHPHSLAERIAFAHWLQIRFPHHNTSVCLLVRRFSAPHQVLDRIKCAVFERIEGPDVRAMNLDMQVSQGGVGRGSGGLRSRV